MQLEAQLVRLTFRKHDATRVSHFVSLRPQADEKLSVKSEQRRYRRRVGHLKSQLHLSDTVRASAQQALLEHARQVPYSGIIVQPKDLDPQGLIPFVEKTEMLTDRARAADDGRLAQPVNQSDIDT